MSYRRRGLGQYIGKQVPGQVNFLDPEPAYDQFRTPGYIEHGSWVTGAPDIVQFYPPERARGIMGLGAAGGLGCFLARIFGARTPPPPAPPGSAPASFADAVDRARGAGGAAPPISVVGRGTVECAGATVYTGDAMTASSYGISAARTRGQPCVIRLTGTPQGDTVVYVDATGRPSRRPPTGTSGMGQILTDFACSGSALNASWTTRTRDTLNAAGQAAVVGGLVAGIAGGLSKKPALGAALGAVFGYGAFKVWTAPFSV